jgi:exodeoxyribonuclease VII large subunit
MSASEAISTRKTLPVLSVSELTFQIKETLEGVFPTLWVAGEISNLSCPQSGHCYLTLKDDSAQIRAVMWRGTAERVKFDLHDGLEVVCQGELEVYAPRGTYQLVIRQIEPKGIGALELALRQLRDKLAKEGLFDVERKRPLPRFPRRIALVTSPTGAAIRDFLQVLRRRWLGADVLIVPARVQGDGAAVEIAEAISIVNSLTVPIDCLVVARGGGSLEDLWSFNEEIVVRAIYGSRIPVVSAIGHEIDVTLADLVADVRALTPSEAAELIVPASDELTETLRGTHRRMIGALRGRAAAIRNALDRLAQRRVMRRPMEMVHDRMQRLDDISARIARGVSQKVTTAQQQIASHAARLEALSPLAVLGRGYSLTRRADNDRIVRDCGDLAEGTEIITQFASGTARSRVIETKPDELKYTPAT